MANILSKDPRKKFIMAALKRKTGATKVTLVREMPGGGTFQGNCMKRESGSLSFVCLGLHEVTAAECGFETDGNGIKKNENFANNTPSFG